MPLPASFGSLALPAIAAPMFLASGVDLVLGTCAGGIVGTFPTLNCRTNAGLDDWLAEIAARRSARDAPFGVNLVVRRSNNRVAADLKTVVAHRVPLVITSLGIDPEVIAAVQGYGGLVFHDVVHRRHAEKAAEAGVDGIIAVAAGAGGHSGALSPFALVAEIRQVFGGVLVLGGAISTGAQIAAARVLGADMAYLGTRFLATHEAMIPQAYKDQVLAARAADIVYTPNISGVRANFLRPSLVAAGLDPDALPPFEVLKAQAGTRAWSNLWSAGHGVGAIEDAPPVADLCRRLTGEYRAAMQGAAGDPFARAAGG